MNKEKLMEMKCIKQNRCLIAFYLLLCLLFIALGIYLVFFPHRIAFRVAGIVNLIFFVLIGLPPIVITLIRPITYVSEINKESFVLRNFGKIYWNDMFDIETSARETITFNLANIKNYNFSETQLKQIEMYRKYFKKDLVIGLAGTGLKSIDIKEMILEYKNNK